MWLVSGHRRLAAARRAGLKVVPCIISPTRRADDLDGFVKLLAEHNLQRVKTRAEQLREEVVAIDPADAHVRLYQYRKASVSTDVAKIEMGAIRRRADISDAKMPMLDKCVEILKAQIDFWPLTIRGLHYLLLNDPPLRHASKPDSTYANTPESYKDLSGLMTRGRLDGLVPWPALDDETRPVKMVRTYSTPAPFLRRSIRVFGKGYCRDLQQSQDHYFEIIGEKSTVQSVIWPVAAEFTIPMTIGRGYCSLPPRAEMSNRFRESGRDSLVVLVLSDHDPDGEEIGQSFCRSMRDDFDIDEIQPIKVALTPEQIKRFELKPRMQAKETSVHHRKFVNRHGSDVFELEALSPAQLQQVLREAIDSVIDRDAFDYEVAEEAKDAAHLEGVRKAVINALQNADLDLGQDEELEE